MTQSPWTNMFNLHVVFRQWIGTWQAAVYHSQVYEYSYSTCICYRIFCSEHQQNAQAPWLKRTDIVVLSWPLAHSMPARRSGWPRISTALNWQWQNIAAHIIFVSNVRVIFFCHVNNCKTYLTGSKLHESLTIQTPKFHLTKRSAKHNKHATCGSYFINNKGKWDRVSLTLWAMILTWMRGRRRAAQTLRRPSWNYANILRGIQAIVVRTCRKF